MALQEIDLPIELSKLKKMGWIKSNRKSDTGIGKTVEDILGIPENNSGQGDCLYQEVEVELKSHRIKSNSMITLFTLEPGIRHLHDTELMQKYGYKNGKGRQALKITLTINNYTPQGLKLKSNLNAEKISIINTSGEILWEWSTSDIHLKLNNLCIVYADSKKENGHEFFKIEKAILAMYLNDKCFFKLIDDGLIKIDLRMHTKPNGGSRNHGTAFRTSSWQELVKCYRKVEQIL